MKLHQGTNLLKETIDIIIENGKTTGQIIFIGSQASGHSCTWEEFKDLANHDYDAGYGSHYVCADLIIAFDDQSRLERREYDGSEWWEFVMPFQMPVHKRPIKTLFIKDYGTYSLSENNKEQS